MKRRMSLALVAALLVGCGQQAAPTAAPAAGALPADAAAVAAERGLTADDIYAAVSTYQPSGHPDDYIMFSSGGQSGQVFVIGVPSMRILRTIAVFAPEPWQGYGYGDETTQVLRGGDMPDGAELNWGDTHHPNLSETNGEYDGQFLFINDKANARMAVIDLRDFETKQIVKNPNTLSDHGGSFVTPNTDYVVEGPQYAMPAGWEYQPVESYNDTYRGFITFWKFDRVAGRVVQDQSFQIELPPYFQDLCDAGKAVSDGWMFCNSLNTERATGGVELGNPPFEAGTTKNDTDYLHAINWKRAAELVAAGKANDVNGIKVLPLDVAAKEGVLYFVPEPKSPHGADVTPNGAYIVVGGKLDPHVTIYSFDKIQKAAEKGGFETDPYGVPVIPLDTAKEAQVELGLGPLHTVFDNQGYAYTTLFLDSMVARWTLGGEYADKHAEAPWTLVQKLAVQYNVGHLTAAEGDTTTPDGKYLVAMSKWSIDRFNNVGPLKPQNFQLIDIGNTGEHMRVLYDLPIGIGEPHYAQIIKADKLKPVEVYPEVGWNPDTWSVDPNAVTDAKDARVERNGTNVEIWMTVVRSHFTPERIEINQGDHVIWHLTNLERTPDATHGFALSGYNINLSLEPGEARTVEFDATQSGTFLYYCTEFCSALHLEMLGYFLVKP